MKHCNLQQTIRPLEPWLMDGWVVGKPVYDFLFAMIELFSLALIPLRRYKAKRVKTRCYQEGVGQFEPRFQGEGVVPGDYFLVSTKLDTICYLTV